MFGRILQRLPPSLQTVSTAIGLGRYLYTSHPTSNSDDIQEPEVDYFETDPQTDRLVLHEIERLSLSEVGCDIGEHIRSSRDVSIYGGLFNRNSIKFFTIDTEGTAGEALMASDSEVDRFYSDPERRYVYCRRVCLEGRRFAIKIIALRNMVDYKNSQREAMIALTIPNHENIVTIYDVIFISNKRMYMVMEFAEFGTLAQFLTDHQLTEQQAINLIRQLLSGLKFMHDNRVVHYDIHDANVLVFQLNDAGDPQVKYVDFGFSVLYGANVTLAKRPDDIKRLAEVIAQIRERTLISSTLFEDGLYDITERMYDEEYNTIDDVIGEFEALVQNRTENPLLNI